MEPTETLSELNMALTKATDDAERAGLHNSIAIRLSEARRFDEALWHGLRSVELRERCALHSPETVGDLAISLANLGGHLTRLERYGDAIAAHARALELLLNMKSSETATVARLAYNAERIGILLWECAEPGLAVRFDGLALATYLSLAHHDQSYKRHVREQLFALSLSLGRAMAPSVRRISTEVAASDLGRLADPSLSAALCLSDWAQALCDDGDVSQALAIARRTIAYCALFEDQETVAAVTAENQKRLSAWSTISSPDGESQADEPLDAVDRRLWCCTGRQLSDLIGDLQVRGLALSDVHALGRDLRAGKLYLARDFAYRCQARTPNVFITYTWSDKPLALQVAVRSALNYLGTLMRQARPDLDPDDVARIVNEKLGIWIDFIFIDQSARNLAEEVHSLLPRVIDSADVHFVLSDTAMLRSWCCYEVALFNARPRPAAAVDHGVIAELDQGVRSFIGRSVPHARYDLFAHTSTTHPEDKASIEAYILESFPGGMHAFDFIMIQSSMLSDPFVSPNFAQSGAAIAQVKVSLDKWLAL